MQAVSSFDRRRPRILVIVGPTAAGKSALAVTLAKEFGAEIVNGDSMQVYRGMDIGTAKPTAAERRLVPHHLFDLVEPDQDFTAADYRRLASQVILDICSRGRLPVVVGGTGLYIRALLAGLADSPGADNAFREECRLLIESRGLAALYELLQRTDPQAAARIHPNNRVRIVRALEVFRQTGRSICDLQQEHAFADSWCDFLKLGVTVDRALLYENIDKRVDLMVSAGLVAEVAALLAAGYDAGLKSMSAIGYREICGHLQGHWPLAEAIELIKRNTRRYAKRQLTWFKGEAGISWHQQPLDVDAITAEVASFVNAGC
jgi:tRNA dimethylallyltransferase